MEGALVNPLYQQELALERQRQDAKYGTPEDRFYRWSQLNPDEETVYYAYVLEMSSVLAGEVGEVAEGNLKREGLAHIREELIQVAATALATVQGLDYAVDGWCAS